VINGTDGKVTISWSTSIPVNQAPTINVSEPKGLTDIADTTFSIQWTASNPDDQASIALYYDSDNSGQNGTEIISNLSENDGSDQYIWDTSALTEGDYYVYAVINDGVNDAVIAYSNGPLTIIHNQAPTINLVEPDGQEDTVDSTFSIQWTASDPNDQASIALYYDSDNSGQNGTEIISNLSENDGIDQYIWDTSALAEGDYYVYAVINDGTNDALTVYSSGPVTITHGNPTCSPPNSGDWIITTDCTLSGTATAPANVFVQNNAVLTINPNNTLFVDFVNQNLTVQDGSGVLIRQEGTIRQSQPDDTPDSVSFTNLLKAVPSTSYTSNTVVLSGFDTSVTVTVSGGTNTSIMKNGENVGI